MFHVEELGECLWHAMRPDQATPWDSRTGSQIQTTYRISVRATSDERFCMVFIVMVWFGSKFDFVN